MHQIKVRNVRSQLVGFLDRDTLKLLSSKLSYEIPGAFFMKQFNPYAGTKFLFVKGAQTFPTGLIHYVREILEAQKIDYEILDERDFLHPGEELPFFGPPLRNYQEEAVNRAFAKQRGILKIATGGGKSLVLAKLIAKINRKTLVLTHKTDLLYQLKRTFEGALRKPIGFVGDGQFNVENITIATIQTIARAFDTPKSKRKKVIDKDDNLILTKADQIRALVENTECLITDECFPGTTKIRVSETEEVPIAEIYKNPRITSVLSYNEHLKQFEARPILRKLQLPLKEDLITLRVRQGKTTYKLTCTENHKLWTSSGYTKAKDLRVGSEVKCLTNSTKRVYCCKYCDSRFVDQSLFKSHLMKHYRRDNKFSARRKVWLQKCADSGKLKTGKNNPVFRHPNTIKKIRSSSKARFNNMSPEKQAEQIQRFMNAPKFKPGIPNKIEQAVIDMKFSELDYTGAGKYIFNFKTPYLNHSTQRYTSRKVPDFKVRGERKVIETYDEEFWHTHREMRAVARRYKAIGYKCLLIARKEFKDLARVRKKIFKFIYNHPAIITNIRKVNRNSTRNLKYVYDLEVEQNHNYIANNILVSNCHHVASDSFWTVYKNAEKAFYRYGVTASPWREDNADLLLEAGHARQLIDVPASLLIEQGHLTPPLIFLYQFKHEKKNRPGTYPEIYDTEVMSNVERNKVVMSCALRASAVGKTVLIAVTKVEHGKYLEEMLKQVEPETIFVYGESDSELRQTVLQELDQKKRKIVICTTIFGEGVDVPSLDVLINCKAAASSVDAFQLAGRVLRRTATKTKAYIIDIFDQNCKYLQQHAKERLKIYQTEPRYTLQVINSVDELNFSHEF